MTGHTLQAILIEAGISFLGALAAILLVLGLVELKWWVEDRRRRQQPSGRHEHWGRN